jgi:hypothetical protein
VSTTTVETIRWDCSVCGQPIADTEGYLLADVTAAMATLRAEAEWDEEHDGRAVDIAELLDSYPDEVRWRSLHGVCDPQPDAGFEYCIEVSRLRSPWDLAWWTAHLWPKNWMRATNWDDLVRAVCERSGAQEP